MSDDEEQPAQPRYDPRTWSGRRLGVAAVVLALLTTTAAAAVLSGSVPVGNGVIPVGTQSGVDVLVEDHGGEIMLEDPWINSTAVDIQTANGNATVVAAQAGNGSLRLVRIDGTTSEISEINAQNTDITVDPATRQPLRVGGGVTRAVWRNEGAVEVDGGTDIVYEADSPGTLTFGGLPANTELAARSASGRPIDSFTTDSNGRGTIEVASAGTTDLRVVDAVSAPTITNAEPADGGGLEPAGAELSATVEDPDFVNNDSVDVTFYLNGNVVETTRISSNQTVTADIEPPLNEQSTWSVEVEDGYGKSDSISQRTFSTPAEIKIYNEAQPTELIDGANTSVEVRFFAQGSEKVVERNVQNGTLNLTGLPAGEQFVVTVDANETGANASQWSYRRIFIDSVFETSNIYLLKEDEPSSEVVFELEDPTGEFPPENTVLLVEKPITKDYDGDGTNETRYQTIAGDTFGASARFPSILQDESRYRLRVKSLATGEERGLGFYQVYASTVEPLKIQRIEPSAGERKTGVVYGGLEGDNDGQLAVRFRGGTNDTTVTYEVTDGSGNVVVPETSVTGQSFAHTYSVNSTLSYQVNATVEYANGTVVQQSFVAGEINGIAGRLTMDGQVLSIISWVAILSTMGLIVIFNPRLAPAGGVGMASALTIIGTVAIPGPLLGIAGAISVLTLFGGGQ